MLVAIQVNALVLDVSAKDVEVVSAVQNVLWHFAFLLLLPTFTPNSRQFVTTCQRDPGGSCPVRSPGAEAAPRGAEAACVLSVP
jgi:hypothetical protein